MRYSRCAAAWAGLLLLLLALLLPRGRPAERLVPDNEVYYIVIHHAASGWDPDPLKPQSSVDTSAAEIDKLHRAKGYDSIGYHYVVRFDGAVEKGRPEDLRGAHARAWDGRGISYNASSIGVCFAGNCDHSGWTAEQRQSGEALIRELMRRYQVPPERVIGHRECGLDTHCPGRLIDMEALRQRLREAQLRPAPTAPAAGPAAGTDGVTAGIQTGPGG